MKNQDPIHSSVVNTAHLQSQENKNIKDNENQITDYEKSMLDEHYNIIETVASVIFSKKKMPPTIDYNDLLSAGFTGFIKAVRGYSENKNTQFKTYANIRVRGEILDLIRKEWTVKSPKTYDSFRDKIKERVEQVINGELEAGGKVQVKNLLAMATTAYVISLDCVTNDSVDTVPDQSEDVEGSLERADEYDSLNSIIATFPKEEQKFIDLFYRRGLNQRQIALEIDTSTATVSRLHSQILLKLKSEISNVK